MLYIFHVDTGTMMTFDMNLAMDTVIRLQEVIAKVCRIPTDKQVLLISGGESLDQNAKVCAYSAGTDTNPIFLFSKSTIEAATPPSASVNYNPEADLQAQVEGSLNMPATYETVVARAQLALQFEDVGKEELRACEKLVHDQHLQHQGWAAVVANLEDITTAFQARAKVFVQSMQEYIANRHLYIEILSSFGETLELLRRIPLLPCLLGEGNEAVFASASQSSYSVPGLSEDPVEPCPCNLLEWINAQDSKNTLEQMRLQCHSGLEQFDEPVRENLDEEVKSVVESINNPSMKEVKGLEDRLYGLEQLMFGARRLIREQSEMAQGFIQNQNRARNLKDPSVLPDLCMSHRTQLKVMLKNHLSMQDIRNRCMAAKEELSVNLHTRLRWVMYVERTICEVDSKLVLHHETLKKLRRRLEILQQMHNAPFIYCSAVVEVVRRRDFSQHFIVWSNNLADDCSKVRISEVAKRETFRSYLKHHFLQALFPGFNDMPPDFATESPGNFDDQLPSIQPQDLDFLKQKVPELADKLTIPEADGTCVRLLDYSPKKLPSSEQSLFLPLDLKVPLADIAQSVTSDIVVLHHNGEQEEVVNLHEEEPLGKSDDAAKDASKSVELTEDRHLTTERSVMLAESPQEPPMKMERMRSPCTPPEVDENEGFTTADFYIDESLPSSMTESARSRKLMELQLAVQDKLVALEFKEQELSDLRHTSEELKGKLNRMSDSFRILKDVAEKGALQLKCEVLGLEKQALKERDDMRMCVDSVTKNVVDVIAKFEEHQESIREQVIRGLKADKERLNEEYEATLELEKQRVLDSHHELELAETMLRAKMDELESLQRKTKLQIEELTVTHKDDVHEIRKQMMLEHEVEFDKAREEWSREGEQKEQGFKAVVTEKELQIAEILEAREALLSQWEKEKSLGLDTLKTDCEAAKEAALVEGREAAQRELESRQREHEEACRGIREQLKQGYAEEEQKWSDKYEELKLKMKEEEEKHAREEEERRKEEEEPVVHLIEDDYLPLERHEEIVNQLKQEMEEEKESLVAQALAEQKEEHDKEMQNIKLHMGSEMQQSLKSSLTAEKQVNFNEALDRVVQERDAKIRGLEEDRERLTQQAATDKQRLMELEDEVKVHKEVTSGEERDGEARASDSVAEAKMVQHKLEEELAESKQLIMQLQSSVMAASVMPVSVDPMDSVHHLQMNLKKKEEEMIRLQHKVMELSMTTSSRGIVQDKVSITTCNVGDTVLLCLDERHDHYVVFTVGTTLHFLHSDCLDALSLRTGPGEPRKSWVLAEILDKEYCQAKKTQNRFKVPIGTKFYRVRARAWSRDSLMASTYRDPFHLQGPSPPSLSDVARSPPLHQDTTIQRAYDDAAAAVSSCPSAGSSPAKRGGDRDSR